MISKNSPLLYPVYRRPYFNEFCGNKKIHEDPNYCYPDSLFQKYDIFEIFILDGGPFFYTCENFGGAKGIDFINNFVDGKLFGILYDGVTIDWNRVEKEQLNEKNALFEKFYWFHRLYFLLPFAHEYFLTRKTKWAEIWFLHFYSWYRHENQNNDKKEAQKNRQNNIFRWFLKKFLKPSIIQYLKSFLRIKKNISGIAWCDMQISWRLLILIHSVFLLKENKFLNEKNWNFIYKCIFEHAEKLYREAKIELKLSMGKGNHFLHKGVAILNVGILYPEIEESKKYVELGREIINFHITHEINKDGANIEGCPSYSHFIAGLHLEAMMLLKANNYFPIPNLEEKIKKEYEFLDQISTPTGLTLPINDSYHLNVETQKAIASQLIPSIDFKPQESLFSPETSFAVIRHSKYTLFVDGMDLDLWHNHHGKPNILLYYDKFPVIIDSGCCNYDRKERLNWYITPEAHNVLIVEPEKEDKNDIYEL
ncbi:heparinase II/III family protein, partial [bacterium]|nr:heparinase II/III family protein [bacterium]